MRIVGWTVLCEIGPARVRHITIQSLYHNYRAATDACTYLLSVLLHASNFGESVLRTFTHVSPREPGSGSFLCPFSLPFFSFYSVCSRGQQSARDSLASVSSFARTKIFFFSTYSGPWLGIRIFRFADFLLFFLIRGILRGAGKLQCEEIDSSRRTNDKIFTKWSFLTVLHGLFNHLRWQLIADHNEWPNRTR